MGRLEWSSFLMIWFLLVAYSILLGAEINAEMERQTVKDSAMAWRGSLCFSLDQALKRLDHFPRHVGFLQKIFDSGPVDFTLELRI